MMVVFHHARASLPQNIALPGFGASGVDIFFVISGFVMAYTTQNTFETAMRGRFDAGLGFLAKRILRIVPLYWLALLWTSRRELWSGTADITGLLKDFFFIPRFNALFPDYLWPSVIQGWTLNYEMFFYLVFAVSFLFSAGRSKFVVGALISLVLFGNLFTAGANSSSIFFKFYSNDILLEFIYGMLLALFLAKLYPERISRYLFGSLMLVGFALLDVGYDHEPRSVFVGLPALLIVWGAIPTFSGLRFSILQNIGNASYAIYLFHWAAFGAANPIAAKVQSALGQNIPMWIMVTLLIVIYLGVAVLAGEAIHFLLEKPFLRGVQARFQVVKVNHVF